MATDLGKVGMRARGNWSNSTEYEVLDAVTYNAALYIAKQAVPAGTLPTNTTYWQAALDTSSMVYEDISETITVSGATLGSAKKAQLGKFVTIIIVITVTDPTNCYITGLPATAVNVFLGKASVGGGATGIEYYINQAGRLNFSTQPSNNASIRISVIYPIA